MANWPYEQREILSCDVCGNCPDEEGVLEHGKGCYTQDEDGGGSEYFDLDAELGQLFPEISMQITPEQIKALVTMLLPLVDQLVAQKGGTFVKIAWPFVRALIANTDAKTMAAAHAALPAEHQVA